MQNRNTPENSNLSNRYKCASMRLSVYCAIFEFAPRQYITVKPAFDRNHRSVLLFFEPPLNCGSFLCVLPHHRRAAGGVKNPVHIEKQFV